MAVYAKQQTDSGMPQPNRAERWAGDEDYIAPAKRPAYIDSFQGNPTPAYEPVPSPATTQPIFRSLPNSGDYTTNLGFRGDALDGSYTMPAMMQALRSAVYASPNFAGFNPSQYKWVYQSEGRPVTQWTEPFDQLNSWPEGTREEALRQIGYPTEKPGVFDPNWDKGYWSGWEGKFTPKYGGSVVGRPAPFSNGPQQEFQLHPGMVKKIVEHQGIPYQIRGGRPVYTPDITH